MKKRIISLFLALTLLVLCLPIGVFAAEPEEESSEAIETNTAIFVESTWCNPDKTVDVKIGITNNPGISGAKFSVSFDEKLSLISWETSGVFKNLDYTAPETLVSPCPFNWDSLDKTATENGTVITLTFEVSSDANINEILNIDIAYSHGDIYDSSLNSLTVTMIGGNLRVIDYMPGDVNEDGGINGKDVTLIRRYNAGGNVDINTNAADVNEDGIINGKDVTLIRRYNAEWPVTLMPSTPKCEHSLSLSESKEATCTEDGNIAYWSCAECGKYFADGDATEEISAESVIVSASGHSEETVSGYAPTYDAPGLTDGKKCSVCGEITVNQTEIPQNEPTYYSITYYDEKVDGYPKSEKYAQHIDLPLPTLTKNGYTFNGWYTGVDGTGEKVVFISAGNTENKILYASWSPVAYTITYKDAPVNNNPDTYTIEDEIILSAPEWTGLIFKNWTDENGTAITKIEKGNIGNITLTANWIYAENMTVTSGNKALHSIVFDEDLELYYFIYEVGAIDNVILKTVEVQDKEAGEVLNWEKSETITVGKDIADSVAREVSNSFSQTSSWSETQEWIKSNSSSVSSTLTAGLEAEALGVKAKLEASITGSTSIDTTESKEYGTSGSTTGGSESSNSVSSTVSFSENSSVTITTENSIPGEMPAGTYSNVCVGKVNVYAIITYDPAEHNYYFDTFSVLDKTVRGKRLYTPFSYSTANISYSEGFDLTFITDNPDTPNIADDGIVSDILAHVESVYYVRYDANGASGSMLTSVFKVDERTNLLKNEFSRTGYVFCGWGTEANGAVLYTDSAEIENLGSRDEIITLYAIWEPIPRTVEWSTGVGYSIVVNRTSSSAGAALEELSSGDNVYYGDVLEIAYEAKTGYTLSTKGATQITVLEEDISSSLIYATAMVNTYTVSYNANGGTGTTLSSLHTYDQSRALTANGFTRTGHVFLGWSTSASASSPEFADNASVINLSSVADATVTLYAVWLKVETTIGYYSRGIGISSNTHSDTFYPSLERDRLIANGYNCLILKITVHGKGDSIVQDEPYFIVYSYTDEEMSRFYLNDFDLNTWQTQTRSLSISLNHVQSDGSFWIKYANDGGKFKLGTVEIQITAIK